MTDYQKDQHINLTEIIDINFLQELQDTFAISMDLASITVDNRGPITKPSNFTDFCIKYTRNSKLGYEKCNECDIKCGQQAAENGEPVIYSCHTGLTDFAVPIMLNGKHIGSILGGQVLTHEPDEEHFRGIAKLYGINEEEYISALREIKIVPIEKIKAAAQLMHLVANSISNTAHKNMELIEKNKREELLRKVIGTVRSTFDIKEVKKKIIKDLGEAFKADRCYFRSFDKVENKFLAPDAEYLGSADMRSLMGVKPDQKGLSCFLEEIKKRERRFSPIVVNKEYAKGTPLGEYLNSIDMIAYYIVPILDKQEELTWLVLYYSTENPKISSDDIKLLETIAYQVDIAFEQIRLFNKANRTAEREKAILSNLPFMAWLKDEQSRFLAVNQVFADKFNLPIEEILGKTDLDIFPDELGQNYIDDDIKVMQSGKQMNVEEEILAPDGIKWHETFKTPLFDQNGKTVGTTGFSRDITEQKEIDRMKNEFVSTVSHELRTPLTSLRGALGLVLSEATGKLPEKAKELLKIANNNSMRLINLINDILDLEKIKAGKYDFVYEELEMNALVEQSVVLNQSYADQFEIKLNVITHVEEAYVKVDKNRILQVISNLISNAVKFSKIGGEVTITSELDNGKVKISLTDKGVGIPDDSKHKIFKSFSQVDSSDTRSKGGTGLGLSICKLILEKMGGEINFISTAGEGSTFFFALPTVAKGSFIKLDETEVRELDAQIESW